MIRPQSYLLFGPNGQLGRRLRAHGADRLQPVDREALDLENPDAVAALIAETPVAGVINAAAWTQVDLAETETERARTINALAPAAMARACAAKGLPFIHVSTDYVFDGAKGSPWVEDDQTGPLNAYGLTKLEGEQHVLGAHSNSLVIRTSWVVSEHGANFIKTMLRLADRPELRIVGDQYGVPTDADALARFILSAADQMVSSPDPSRTGLLHFRNSGEPISWAEFARAIFEVHGKTTPSIEAISTAEFGAPAPRPANSVLSIDRLEKTWRHTPPHWREGLARILGALKTES